MTVAPALLSILRCPESKKPLIYFNEGDDGEFLFCPESRLRFSVDDDIPVMLVEEATRLGQEESDQLVALAKKRGLIK